MHGNEGFSILALLTFGATYYMIVGTVLYIVRCLAASLALPARGQQYSPPVATLSFPHCNLRCFQTFPIAQITTGVQNWTASLHGLL